MRWYAPYVAAALLALTSGCTRSGGLASYWDSAQIPVTQSGYAPEADRFATFAELAVQAPEEEWQASLDRLFSLLGSDEVSFYIYEEWIESAFYNVLSPCRSARIFDYAASRILSDGTLTDRLDALAALRRYNSLNLPGSPLTLPPLQGSPDIPGGQACTILVVDPSCRTCTASLSTLAGGAGRHIAVCVGPSPAPDVPGWEYYRSPSAASVFDTQAAPFWFATDSLGIVTVPYSPVPEPSFAKPSGP